MVHGIASPHFTKPCDDKIITRDVSTGKQRTRPPYSYLRCEMSDAPDQRKTQLVSDCLGITFYRYAVLFFPNLTFDKVHCALYFNSFIQLAFSVMSEKRK